MDACEIASFLAKELFMNQFASFDGIHSGVPTKTTPTLTPTTLKNIEQTFMELTNDTSSNIPCQAGFVPPPYQFEDHSQDPGENSRDSMSSDSNGSWPVSPPPIISEDLDSKSSSTSLEPMPLQMLGDGTTLTSLNPVNMTGLQNITGAGVIAAGSGKPPSHRNKGGRRPTKASNLSPEEEEKRRVRRERNKMAAARCRRRREDHTNELLDETDQLEKKKQGLQDEIKQLQQEKEDLEFLLDSHREHCRFTGRRSPLERKPVELVQPAQPAQQQQQQQQQPQQQHQQQQQQHHQQHQQQQHLHLATDLKVILPMQIKSEPEEMPDQLPAKRLKLSNALSDSLDTPTPTSIAPVLTSVNLPRVMLQPGGIGGLGGLVAAAAAASAAIGGRPMRPTNLDVKSTGFPLLNVRHNPMDAGMGTPSSGLFNFDSLMDGGTGLTPIAAPISLQSNRGPLDLITPTSSEPSKLCSL